MLSSRQTKCENVKLAYASLMKFYPLTLNDLDGEQWCDINGYEGIYQISNYGRVKSFQKGSVRILKPVYDVYGYLRAVLSSNGSKRLLTIHRLVAKAFLPNPSCKPQVNHCDGHKLNNHVSNLEWVTAAENVQHSFYIGLQTITQGEDHFLAKLTNTQAVYIRENPDRLTLSELATMFGLSKSAVDNIILGKTYKNVGGVIRGAHPERLSANIRAEIRKVYVKGDSNFGSRALARKYGVSHSTIRRIINE